MVSDQYNTFSKLLSQMSDGPNKSRIAAYINRVLKSIYEADKNAVVMKHFQAQSSRRGGAAYTSSGYHVNLSDLAHRGLWTMDGFATLLEYIAPTNASDQVIGKVFGGWTEPKEVCVPPTLREFAQEAQDVQ